MITSRRSQIQSVSSKLAAKPEKDIKKQQNDPMRLEGLSNIVDIACGASFTLGKSADGKVYSWGIGECGELGRYAPPLKFGEGEEATYDMPNILKHHITPGAMYLALPGDSPRGLSNNNDSSRKSLNNQVKAIGCGAYHAMVTTVGDHVYACGLNNYGQLGTGTTDNSFYLQAVISLEGKSIVALTGGMHHSLVLSSTGQIYAFGRGDSSQLGSTEVTMNAAGDFSAKPVKPTLPPNTVVVSISAGGNHNLVVTNKNEVYSWGYGEMLQLGHGEEKDETLPKKLNFAKAKIKNINITQV
jgi:regulator of chromosome condensation